MEHRRGWRTMAPERPAPEAGRLLEMLGRLTPTQAVQYGLGMAENLSAEETATELDAVGVTVADDVVAKVEERTGLPEADQRALLAGRAFDPTVLHNPADRRAVEHPVTPASAAAARRGHGSGRGDRRRRLVRLPGLAWTTRL
jgi:hypothetical protein